LHFIRNLFIIHQSKQKHSFANFNIWYKVRNYPFSKSVRSLLSVIIVIVLLSTRILLSGQHPRSLLKVHNKNLLTKQITNITKWVFKCVPFCVKPVFDPWFSNILNNACHCTNHKFMNCMYRQVTAIRHILFAHYVVHSLIFRDLIGKIAKHDTIRGLCQTNTHLT
jgi:hypothetical protein